MRGTIVSRRAFIAGGSLLTACGHARAPRYQGWLFVASAAEKAVVVADLASFQHSGTIPVGAVPEQVLSARGKVFAVCGGSQSVVEIDPVRQTVTGRIAVGGRIAGAALSMGGAWLAVAISQPAAVVFIDTASGGIVRRTRLAGIPQAIDASGAQVAVLLLPEPDAARTISLARVSISDGVVLGVSAIGPSSASALGYRRDGRTIYVAASDSRQIVTIDALSGMILARLPVPIRPARFCADGSGGQVFVTGADRTSQVVIFSPYQNQVDQALNVGHAPFGMAVAPARNLLFLTDPEAGDVTIVEIETRRITASIRTGGNPREVLIATAPGGPEEYALVVDGESGNVSVIHIPVVLHKRGDAIIAETPKPVFAVFYGGGAPQSAVIVPHPA